jgi:hypothetical protein
MCTRPPHHTHAATRTRTHMHMHMHAGRPHAHTSTHVVWQIRSIGTKDELFERLMAGGALEKLCDSIWPKLEILKAGPATAAELAEAWKTEGAGDLLYGGLPAFFQGLEARIGSPDPKILKEMMADHCSRPDSQVEFTTGNYSVVTTSEVGSSTCEPRRSSAHASHAIYYSALRSQRAFATDGVQLTFRRAWAVRACRRSSGNLCRSPTRRSSGPSRSG